MIAICVVIISRPGPGKMVQQNFFLFFVTELTSLSKKKICARPFSEQPIYWISHTTAR